MKSNVIGLFLTTVAIAIGVISIITSNSVIEGWKNNHSSEDSISLTVKKIVDHNYKKDKFDFKYSLLFDF